MKFKRWHILHDLVKNKKHKVGAEIGCLGGRMTVEVLKSLPSIEIYYAIDSWEWYPDYENSLNKNSAYAKNFENDPQGIYNVFKQKTKQWENKIKILKMFSSKAVNQIENGILDFCFIDGNHAYEYVKEDIKNYLPKMKKGGLLGGHDYGYKMGGVKEAVNEMFNKTILKADNTWWVWIK